MGWWKYLVWCWMHFFGPPNVRQAPLGPYRMPAPRPALVRLRSIKSGSGAGLTILAIRQACVCLMVLAVIGPRNVSPDGTTHAQQPVARSACRVVSLAPICRVGYPPYYVIRDGRLFPPPLYAVAMSDRSIMICTQLDDLGGF
jgi:hypothetical protein